MDVVVKTILGMQPLLASAYDELLPKKHVLRTPVSTCFEIFGFDIMMDEDLKVWLLEMNHMPSLSGSSPLDTAIKTGVVNGALDRLHITTRRKQILTSRLSKKRRWLILQQAASKARALALGQGGPGIPPPTAGSSSSSSLPRGGPSLPRFGPPRNSTSSSSTSTSGGPSNNSGAHAGGRRSSVAASSSKPPPARTSTSKGVLPQIVSQTKERGEQSKPTSHDTAKTLASGKGELLSRSLGTADIEIESTKSEGRMNRDSRDGNTFEAGSEEEEDDDDEEDGDDEEEVDASTRLLGVGRGEMEQRAVAESRGQSSDVAGTPFADVKVLREAPKVDQPDGYVLVFSQQQLHYRQLYGETIKAAEVAMKDKVAQSLHERPQSANWMEGHSKSKGG